MNQPDKRQVRNFWNSYPCGKDEYLSGTETAEDFQRFDRAMYNIAPGTHDYARQKLEPLAGRKLLEIGCGVGRDGRYFAGHGADYFGGDLTENAIALTRRSFTLLELPGRFLRIDAEQLPLVANCMDSVYSWGVIHHSPHIDKSIAEIFRVLKPGGKLLLLLYNKNSYQYYYNMLVKKRFMLTLIKYSPLWLVKLMTRFDRRILAWKDVVATEPISNANLCRWFSDGNGRYNPLTNVYTQAEVREMLSKFVNVHIRVFPILKWGIFGNTLLRLFGHRIGWDMIIYAEKQCDRS